MFWNTFVPHFGLLFHHQIAQPLYRWFILGFMRETIVTQAQMDDLYKRPTLCLETRAAVAFNTVYCGLLFSGGMPITIPLAAVSLGLQRLADKYACAGLSSAQPHLPARWVRHQMAAPALTTAFRGAR